MIKTKILIPFTDKVTGKKYKKDAVIDMTVSRFNEVVKKGLVEAYEEPTPKKEK